MKRLDRKDTFERQWVRIWETVFPGNTPPESVWLGTQLEETILLMRLTWERTGQGIVSSILAEEQASAPGHLAGPTSSPDTVTSTGVDLKGLVIRTVTQVLNRFQTESRIKMSQDKPSPPSLPHSAGSTSPVFSPDPGFWGAPESPECLQQISVPSVKPETEDDFLAEGLDYGGSWLNVSLGMEDSKAPF